MGSFLERLHVESVPGLYCTKKFGHPVKACAFLRKEPRRCWKGELASDIYYCALRSCAKLHPTMVKGAKATVVPIAGPLVTI
jgi:hypothetical protein